jgi:hypothetical protein
LSKEAKDHTINSFSSDHGNPVYDPLSQPNTLNDLILDSIDETLSDLLGTRGRDLIYDHIARNYSFGREDIPLHLNEFLILLETTFSKGSKTICRTIIRRLYSKLGWDFNPVPCFGLNDYLEATKARIGRELFERAKVNHRGSIGKSDAGSE